MANRTPFRDSNLRSSFSLPFQVTYGSEEDDAGQQKQDVEEKTEYPCLLRASDGGKVKFSTRVRTPAQLSLLSPLYSKHQVNSSDLEKFHTVYGALLKSAFTASLRKRDKKRERLRAEEALKKRKKMVEDVVVEGPKRGKGRRARQRKVKALLKQEQGRNRWRERESAGKMGSGTGMDGVGS